MYFKLKFDFREEVIGKQNCQIDSTLDCPIPYELREHRDVKHLDDFSRYDFQLEYFLVNKGSILTDLLKSDGSFTTRHKMISNQLFEVLREYKIPDHDFFPCTLKMKSTGKLIYNYGVLRLRITGAEIYANYDESNFVLRTGAYKEPTPIQIGSFQELQDEYSNFRGAVFRCGEPLVFNEEFNLDLFNLRTNIDWYISKSLKDRLIYEGFTGLAFEEDLNIIKL